MIDADWKTKVFEIDESKIQNYLFDRLNSNSIKMIFMFILFSIITLLHYLLSNMVEMFITVPFYILVIIGVGHWGNKRVKKECQKLFGRKFELTRFCIVQKSNDKIDKKFEFYDIALIEKSRLGAKIIKGNTLTKIDYYMPKRYSSLHFDESRFIFVPSITKDYDELIQTLEICKKNAYN